MVDPQIEIASRRVANSHVVESLYDPQLRIDSRGRLYVGTNEGLHVFDTSGAVGFHEVASRAGPPAGRFGLREDGNTVHVYYVRFRDKGVIGTTAIQFVN